MVLIKFYEFICPAAETDLLAVVECVHTVARVDALDKVYFAGIVGRTHKIGAGFIKSDGVERGEDADVTHFRVFGRGVTVAVDREVVGYADINDAVAAVVGDGFGSLGH